jgi:DNA-binding GntR family transcriptional regulator
MARPKTIRSNPAGPAASSRKAASRSEPGLSGANLDNRERFSRTAWLANIIRERILEGTYRPGEWIREVQLREEFGFSNGPIREALQATVADGLAERAPWQGVRVKTLSEDELIELFQVRLALLEYASELAAQNTSTELRATADALKGELRSAFNRFDSSGGHPSFNGSLSQWLLNSTGNKTLRAIWHKTMQQTLIYVNASLARSQGQKSRKIIERLIDAICAGKVAAARAAARELTQQTLVDLEIKAKKLPVKGQLNMTK